MIQRQRFLLAPVCLTLLWLAGCATAPNVSNVPPQRGNTQERVTADLHNPDADFSVTLQSRQSPPLYIGELLDLRLRSTKDAYVSLYAIHSSGQTSRLIDNHPVRAGRTLRFPGRNSQVDFKLSPPPGTETYLMVAITRPLRWLAPADIRKKGALTPLKLSGIELRQRLRAALARENPYSWNGAVLNLPVQAR